MIPYKKDPLRDVKDVTNLNISGIIGSNSFQITFLTESFVAAELVWGIVAVILPIEMTAVPRKEGRKEGRVDCRKRVESNKSYPPYDTLLREILTWA